MTDWNTKQKINTSAVLVSFLQSIYSEEISQYRLTERQVKVLSFHLTNAITLTHRHCEYLTFEDWKTYPITTSIPSKRLQKDFGVKYPRVCSILFDRSREYFKDKHTYAYKLKLGTVNNLLRFIKETLNVPLSWETRNGRQINSIPCGVLRTTDKRKRAVSRVRFQ
jgi:hypothetical protein